MLASRVDWSACEIVEVDPQRVGGRPVVKGTRMPVDDILANYEFGVSVTEIAEQFEIAPQVIQELLAYAERHQTVACPI